MSLAILVSALVLGTPASADTLERLILPVGPLRFTVLAAGPRDGPLVLLLHGFPETGFAWRRQLERLGALGYRAVAPDQRGYSPGARPPNVADYALPRLVGDVLGIATALGAERFDLVGHDWGGAVAWVAAATAPSRVRSLTVLSTPHVSALAAARADSGSEQSRRSSYFADFAKPGAEAAFLADGARRLRALYATHEPEAREAHLAVLDDPAALRAALAWYAAAFGPQPATAPQSTPAPDLTVTVPTLYIFGEADPAFARTSALATAGFVAGAYRFVPLPGVGHWLTEQASDTVTAELVAHLGRRP